MSSWNICERSNIQLMGPSFWKQYPILGKRDCILFLNILVGTICHCMIYKGTQLSVCCGHLSKWWYLIGCQEILPFACHHCSLHCCNKEIFNHLLAEESNIFVYSVNYISSADLISTNQLCEQGCPAASMLLQPRATRLKCFKVEFHPLFLTFSYVTYIWQ